MVPSFANRSDDELIAAIAEQRDAEAFTVLFKRHEHAAYGLALHITGQKDLAEEAVQEAALRLWLSARLYRTGNVARSWLLGIVAGKSLEVLRARRRRGRARTPEARSTLEAESGSIRPEERVEKNEGLAALRLALEGLPRLERQLLALHFGGGLSHEEIGTAMAMPRRTISYKLGQALKALRAQLVQAGFGALAPLLGAEGLHQALTSGAQAPAGLCERVSAGLTKAARESLRAGQLGAAKGAWSPRLLLPAGLALAAAGAVVFWWAAGFKPVVPKTEAQVSSGPQQVLPAPPAQAAPKNEPFLRHWDFNTPEQAQDFKVTRGSWHYVPDGGPDGSGCMETETEIFEAGLNQSGLDHTRCFLVFVRVCPLMIASTSVQKFNSAVFWRPYALDVNFRNVGYTRDVWGGQARFWSSAQNYLAHDWVDRWTDGKRSSFEVYEGVSDTARLHLGTRGRHRIDLVEVREIQTHELPDVSAYLAALAKIPQDKREGQVVVPELKSLRPPAPVIVQFYREKVPAAPAVRE